MYILRAGKDIASWDEKHEGIVSRAGATTMRLYNVPVRNFVSRYRYHCVDEKARTFMDDIYL